MNKNIHLQNQLKVDTASPRSGQHSDSASASQLSEDIVIEELSVELNKEFVKTKLKKYFKDLYKDLSRDINSLAQFGTVYCEKTAMPSCQWISWDWWNLHRGVIAQKKEWRYLIRVTETDYQQPETDLRKVLRTQQNVYVPMEFGW